MLTLYQKCVIELFMDRYREIEDRNYAPVITSGTGVLKVG